MQREKTMRQMAPFDIPDHYPNVLYWFRETLESYTEREYQGSPTMELRMLGPRSEKIRGPNGDVATADEIVMLGFQTKEWSELKGWGGTVELKDVWKPLGQVMAFSFYPISRDETRVWASYREDLATVWSLFRRFVTEEIEKQYPAVGLLWREHEAKLEMQRLELIEKHMQMKSDAAGRAAGADTDATTEGGAGTRADDAKAGAQPQLADEMGTEQDAQPSPGEVATQKRRRGRLPTAPKEKNLICAAWLKVQYDVTQDDFCNGKGISSSLLRSWLKNYPYPES